MHTALNRLNTALTFFGTVVACLCILTSLTDLAHTADPRLDVRLKGVKRLTTHRGKQDTAVLSIGIDADFSSCFSWNTKQLFVFLQAEYATPENGLNQVVLWDKIIERRADAVVQQNPLRQKYALIDQGTNFRGMPLNLTVVWNVMPRVGMLSSASRSFAVGSLPDEYVY